MSSFRDRIVVGVADAAATLVRVAGAIRSPQVTPEAHLPGVAGWGGYQTSRTNEELLRALISPEGYFHKVTNDAGPSMTRFSSYPANDLTPEKIVGAQQEAAAGWPLRWSEMIEQVLSRDSHLSGIAQQRIDDVIKGSWRLQRSRPDLLALLVRNFCDEVLRDVDDMKDADEFLLGSNSYGYACVEQVWKIDRVSFQGHDGRVVGPFIAIVQSKMDAVHAKHFRFDIRTDEPQLWFGGGTISLPYGKFIFVKGEGSHPITERRGFMWPCVWLSMIRAIGFAGWASWVERFGMPIPLVTYDGDVTQYNEHKHLYDQLLRLLGNGVGGVVPGQNFKIDFAQPQGGGRSSDPHSALADACDSAQSIRVLGATLTAKISNAGSFAASSTHTEVKYNKEERDTTRLWSAKRRDVLGPLVRFNARALAEAIRDAYPEELGGVVPELIVRRIPMGMQRVPRDVDITQSAEVMSSAINEWGMPISMESIYDRFDLTAPISDEDRAPGKPQQITSGGKVMGTVEAATDGGEAPKDPPASSSASKSPTHEDSKAGPPPTIDPIVHIDLAPTDVASIVTVDQALISQGLPPVGGDDGRLTITEFKAKRAAVIAKAAAADSGETATTTPSDE